MLVGLAWLNRLLDPPFADVHELEDALTRGGFPIESIEALPDGDHRLDVEVTSNRGDCMSHAGLAREAAAITGRRLTFTAAPEPPASDPDAAERLRLENRVPGQCPRFTARVIEGVRVGPSPAWLARALESVGQRSINNVVDATNFVNLELGHPCHAFDLERLDGAALIVRLAEPNERLTTLDGKPRTLAGTEVVVADARRAQSLAGVIGGGESEVRAQTRDVVLEVATWDPRAVRAASRRHQVRTDASARFERRVPAGTIDAASRRLAALVLEVAGGSLRSGMLDAGPMSGPASAPAPIALRLDRCRDVLGIAMPEEEAAGLLERHGIGVTRGAPDRLDCTPPPHRPDLSIEEDLIEEIARTAGLDRVPTRDRICVQVRPAQRDEAVLRGARRALTSLGFHETVTFSFVTDRHAAMFLPAGLDAVRVDDERRGREPALRPSVIPSLLLCRRTNQDARADAPGGVRLFEVGAVFAQRGAGAARESIEHANIGLILDAGPAGAKADHPALQAALRAARAAVEAIVTAAVGPGARVRVGPTPEVFRACRPGSVGDVCAGDVRIGCVALLSDAAQAEFGLESPVAFAEVGLAALRSVPAGLPTIAPLPEFPAVERDVSLVVDEVVSWADVERAIAESNVDRLERVRFIGAYRGKQLGPGKKSVTARLWFRDPLRTLRREEVDPQVLGMAASLRGRIGAELRA